MKDELNCSYIGGGVAYLMQSVAIHFNLTVVRKTRRFKTVGGATLDSNILCLLEEALNHSST